jgi:hypothetical protein
LLLAQLVRELRARFDLQLPEHLVKVIFDGARADEQLSCDLPVGISVGCELRDVRTLRGQLVSPVSVLDGSVRGALSRDLQPAAGTLGERNGPEFGEEQSRCSSHASDTQPIGLPPA